MVVKRGCCQSTHRPPQSQSPCLLSARHQLPSGRARLRVSQRYISCPCVRLIKGCGEAPPALQSRATARLCKPLIHRRDEAGDSCYGNACSACNCMQSSTPTHILGYSCTRVVRHAAHDEQQQRGSRRQRACLPVLNNRVTSPKFTRLSVNFCVRESGRQS